MLRMDLPNSQELIQRDGFINAYTDGSCNYKSRQLGIGIIITTTAPNKYITFSERITPDKSLDLREYGPLSAEFSAATYALNKLPENSNVRLHTDHPILRKVLRRHTEGKNMLWKPRQIPEHTPEFKSLVSSLKQAISRHNSIEVVNAKDTTDPFMKLAHQAAAKGSGARGIKTRLRQNPSNTL